MTPTPPPQSPGALQAMLAELEAAEAKATPGPWWVEQVPRHAEAATPHLIKYQWDDVPTWLAESSIQNPANNFALICLARNSLPALLQAIRERDAEIEQLKEDLHLCNGTCDLALKHRDFAEAEVERLKTIVAAALAAHAAQQEKP